MGIFIQAIVGPHIVIRKVRDERFEMFNLGVWIFELGVIFKEQLTLVVLKTIRGK